MKQVRKMETINLIATKKGKNYRLETNIRTSQLIKRLQSMKKKMDRDEEVAPTPTLQTQLCGIIRRNCSPATKNKSKVNKFKP